ncbi:MAG: sulfite exporter TauE/SafE family protein [Acidobacteriaceae bacterium]|nr:sulfite exporter TauE/SafE family protein [Acidobacteriaceae bacterium]MBV9779481.1 sulfite exporter TauE/SafE family protein [Acidobacteriaceae bacterium]
MSHYARLDLSRNGSSLTYVLDFAEIPTLELLQEWNLDANQTAELKLRARQEAKQWLKGLAIEENGRAISAWLQTVQINIQDGAGGMPILRVTMISSLGLRSGKLEYEDRNYPGRTGWKEIVIHRGSSARVVAASSGDTDISHALTSYPADPSFVPPQALKASVDWKCEAPPVVFAAKQVPSNPEVTVPNVRSALKPFAAQQPIAPGTVVKGDFLSRLLKMHTIGLGLVFIGIAVAFGLGAMHALSPGHGKTIVAAYLVGSRGTIRHAVFLGSTVTLTHTVSVFLLGIGVLCFERYIVPDRIIPWLGALSGLSIVVIGLWLLYQRAKVLVARHSEHGHARNHPHSHSHPHAHDHSHDHHHDHDHANHAHTHDHGDRPHTHVVPEKVSLASLIALGVSGGLVPCPSALVLMLSAIALGHAGLGLALLVGFSLGLALVLMGIGILVIHAKNLIPNRPAVIAHPFFRLVPVLSAALVLCLGLGMTAVSLGWLRPGGLGI